MPNKPAFGFQLSREFLQRLLDDEALYFRLGPWDFVFQLDNGRNKTVRSIDELLIERPTAKEWKFAAVLNSDQIPSGERNDA
jgi:hypothetical protein